MAHPATEIAVDELSVEERLPLLGRLWDSLLDSGPPPVPAWHQDIIRQRIAAAGANPGASIPLRRTPRGFAAEAGMKVPVSVSPAITDDIRVLVGDSGALSKANALCALVPHAKDDAVLIEDIVTASKNSVNMVWLMGTISVAHVAIACLYQVGTQTALDAATKLLATWPEPDRSDLLWYLRSEGHDPA